MQPSEFHRHVAEALGGCQLVEQELKLYLSEAFQLIVKTLGGLMPFKMSGNDYQDASLERLIETFKKLSDNPLLLEQLGRFKDERNFLSHRSITYCLDPEGELDMGTFEELEPRLLAISPEAMRLQAAIHEEGNKFRPHLWFEDVE